LSLVLPLLSSLSWASSAAVPHPLVLPLVTTESREMEGLEKERDFRC
jgi:hypothetical protein